MIMCCTGVAGSEISSSTSKTRSNSWATVDTGRGWSAVYWVLVDNGGVKEPANSMLLIPSGSRRLLMVLFWSDFLGTVGVCKLSGLEVGGGTCTWTAIVELAVVTLDVVV